VPADLPEAGGAEFVLCDAAHRLRVIRRLRQRAVNLGFSLVRRETGELIKGAVS